MKISGASLPCNQFILRKRSDKGYAWKRGESIVSAWVEILGDSGKSIDSYGGREVVDTEILPVCRMEGSY